MRERELITPDEVRQGDARMVYVFAGKKPPILAHRLEWFELFNDADAFLRENPPPEPRELPLPGVSLMDGLGGASTAEGTPHVGEGKAPDGAAGKERERTLGKEARGYVEPDL